MADNNVAELPARPVPTAVRRGRVNWAEVLDFEPGRQSRTARKRDDAILAAYYEARRLVREYRDVIRGAGFESIADLRAAYGEIVQTREQETA